MKVKDELESCGPLNKEHGYLGHFKKPEFMKVGHNSEPISDEVWKQAEAERLRQRVAKAEEIRKIAEAEARAKVPDKKKVY